MSIEQPREFAHIQNLGDGYNVMCDVLPIAHFRQQQETEEFCERFNLAIERRLAEMGIGQEIHTTTFQCIICQRQVSDVAYYLDLNGPLCRECKDKGHVGHPATPERSKPKEPSLTVVDIGLILSDVRDEVYHSADNFTLQDRHKGALDGIADVERHVLNVLQDKATEDKETP